jgi:hypothetical protein
MVWCISVVNLLPGETIVMQDDAKSDYFGKGTLIMTSGRILMEIKTGGLLSKTTEVKLDKALGTIKAVSAPGGKQLQMQFEGSVEPTNIHVSNAEKWEAAIKSALAVSGKM